MDLCRVPPTWAGIRYMNDPFMYGLAFGRSGDPRAPSSSELPRACPEVQFAIAPSEAGTACALTRDERPAPPDDESRLPAPA